MQYFICTIIQKKLFCKIWVQLVVISAQSGVCTRRRGKRRVEQSLRTCSYNKKVLINYLCNCIHLALMVLVFEKILFFLINSLKSKKADSLQVIFGKKCYLFFFFAKSKTDKTWEIVFSIVHIKTMQFGFLVTWHVILKTRFLEKRV